MKNQRLGLVAMLETKHTIMGLLVERPIIAGKKRDSLLTCKIAHLKKSKHNEKVNPASEAKSAG